MDIGRGGETRIDERNWGDRSDRICGWLDIKNERRMSCYLSRLLS